MSKRISVMIIPEGQRPRKFQISVLWLKILAGVAALFVVIVILSSFSYARLMTRAMDRDRLVAENEKLKVENARIVALAEEVEKNRKSLDRIVRSLGGKIEMPDTPASTSESESEQ